MDFDNRLLSFAGRMADEAGRIARLHWRTPITGNRKGDGSPVTIADTAIEAALRGMIVKEYPHFGIFGEEEARLNPGAEWQWVIDPIDGTRAFMAGFSTFTTLIALAFQNVPIFGIIDQPVQRERFIGIAENPTRCNEKPIHTRADVSLEGAMIATTSTDYFTLKQAEAFARLRARCASSVLGGDAYAYAMLATGQLDVVIDAAMKPYDFCALAPVIEGAGGIITDWQGNPLTLNSDGNVIAAANRALHTTALALLSPAG